MSASVAESNDGVQQTDTTARSTCDQGGNRHREGLMFSYVFAHELRQDSVFFVRPCSEWSWASGSKSTRSAAASFSSRDLWIRTNWQMARRQN